MSDLDYYDDRARDGLTPQNEEDLKRALEDGDERSRRTWGGKRYGVQW